MTSPRVYMRYVYDISSRSPFVFVVRGRDGVVFCAARLELVLFKRLLQQANQKKDASGASRPAHVIVEQR